MIYFETISHVLFNFLFITYKMVTLILLNIIMLKEVVTQEDTDVTIAEIRCIQRI